MAKKSGGVLDPFTIFLMILLLPFTIIRGIMRACGIKF